jgi:hypothetical protein
MQALRKSSLKGLALANEMKGINPSTLHYGGIAQWLELTAHNGSVAGSSPAAPT